MVSPSSFRENMKTIKDSEEVIKIIVPLVYAFVKVYCDDSYHKLNEVFFLLMHKKKITCFERKGN